MTELTQKRIMLNVILRMLRYAEQHPRFCAWHIERDHLSWRNSFVKHKDWLVWQKLLRRKTEYYNRWHRTRYWITMKGEQLLKMFMEVK